MRARSIPQNVKLAARAQARYAFPDSAPCERCGSTENVQRHHTDYGQPKAIQFLCRPCHDLAENGPRSPRSRRMNNASGFKGVYAYKTGWRAELYSGGNKHLGTFRSAEEAARAYDAAARERYGESAVLNFSESFSPAPSRPSRSVTAQGARTRRDNGCGFKGVRRKGHRWIAVIEAGGPRKHLGTFETAEEAARAYDAAARDRFGHDAWQNFPEGVQ